MGVSKLWDILLTIAVQKNIQDLSGLVLAIDASLWIVKINSIFQNVDEGLKCIFNKLVWLKKNNIKPIFVFDGQTPALKRKTLEQRRNRRRQVSEIDLSKKVEIEIVKTVTGVQSQKSQKQSLKNEYTKKTQQIQQLLNNMLKYQNSTNTIELSEKMSMQAQVLNKKYQLYAQICPKIIKKHGNLQQFYELDIETKQQILQEVKQNDLPSGKDLRMIKQKMSEEEKIMYEMELIKKKSKILQLQDNLYRKVMTKKIQNGYEIIEGVYNGKKVIQKRKVKSKNFDQWGTKFSKRQTCNNFFEIFQKNREKEQSQKSSNLQEDKGDFFSKIFNKDYTTQKRDSQKCFQEVSQKLTQVNDRKKFYRNNSNQNPKNPAFQNSQVPQAPQSQQFPNYYSCFDQPSSQSANPNPQPQDPDFFPDFVPPIDSLPASSSTSHVHLQNMLDILGIMYITAPFQAEAQCAALEQMQLVDGVVTEDSDTFLFGARKVYRGVFQDNIKYYDMGKIQAKLLMTREKMIIFGLMLGSDYTDGVKGIGIVNAMEILKICHDFQGLERFTLWAKAADLVQDQENKTQFMIQNAMSQDQKEYYLLHKKFKNYWHVHPKFPQKNIYDAYMDPDIQSDQRLEKKIKQNKQIHFDALQKLMEEKFKFVPLQIQLNMKIVKKKFQRKKQTSITDFTTGNLAKIVSKRLQKAINFNQQNN